MEKKQNLLLTVNLLILLNNLHTNHDDYIYYKKKFSYYIFSSALTCFLNHKKRKFVLRITYSAINFFQRK